MTLLERYKGISASSLHKFDLSPKLFKLYIDKELEEEEKAYLDLGIKLHMYLLEPDEFKNNYIYLEFETPSSSKQKEFCEEVSKLYKKKSNLQSLDDLGIEVYKKIYSVSGKSEDKIKEESIKLIKSLTKYLEYLNEKDHFKDILNFSTQKFLNDAKFAVGTHMRAKDLILTKQKKCDYENELRILWEYPLAKINEESLVLKSFLDRVIINHTTKEIILVDLKTTSNISEFEERFESFNYKRQMALYWLALGYYLKNSEKYQQIFKEYTYTTYIVVVQTNMGNNQIPIECRVYPISENTLDNGLVKLQKTLEDVAWHFQHNKWDHTRNYYENNGIEKTL